MLLIGSSGSGIVYICVTMICTKNPNPVQLFIETNLHGDRVSNDSHRYLIVAAILYA